MISDATSAQKARVASLMGRSGESVGRVSSAVSTIMAGLNGSRDENSLEAAATGIAGLREGGIKVTDSSMVMNTELATAIHLEGMLTLAEAIVGSEG
jgi:succinate dehydrogenase/fumarate reductase flavoprotein subunit